jgi:hypothetical protein
MRTALGPDREWSPDLSIKLKCAIGDCISLYSEIESCIVEIIWMLKPDLDGRRQTAKAWGG